MVSTYTLYPFIPTIMQNVLLNIPLFLKSRYPRIMSIILIMHLKESAFYSMFV